MCTSGQQRHRCEFYLSTVGASPRLQSGLTLPPRRTWDPFPVWSFPRRKALGMLREEANVWPSVTSASPGLTFLSDGVEGVDFEVNLHANLRRLQDTYIAGKHYFSICLCRCFQKLLAFGFLDYMKKSNQCEQFSTMLRIWLEQKWSNQKWGEHSLLSKANASYSPDLDIRTLVLGISVSRDCPVLCSQFFGLKTGAFLVHCQFTGFSDFR